MTEAGIKAPATEPDTLVIRRVANGWVIHPGGEHSPFTHVAQTAEDVIIHVRGWTSLPVTIRGMKP